MTTLKKDIFGGAILAVPGKGLKGDMTVPGDKSISNRAVMPGLSRAE